MTVLSQGKMIRKDKVNHGDLSSVTAKVVKAMPHEIGIPVHLLCLALL